ncbi:MAG TPA: Gldg family protein, partial [Vicinamibacteria bacterium]|nr:Gldg family protein [Vicinamibacteria bacterium]
MRGSRTGRETAAACLLLFLIGAFTVKVTRHWGVPPLEAGRFKPTQVSPGARARLAALPDPAFVTYYVSDRARMPSRMRQVERGVTEVLGALRRASGGRLDYQVVDPEDDPDLQRYAARRGIAPFRARSVERDAYSERTVWSALSIACGDHPESAINDVGPEHLPRLQTLVLEHLALMETPRRPVVALSRALGFSELSAALGATAEVVVADPSAGRLPERSDLLFWLEPTGRPEELRTVDDFLTHGGSVVVAGSEKAAAAGAAAGDLRVTFRRTGNDMEAVLDHFGLRALPGLVLDAVAEEMPGRGAAFPFFVRSLPYSQDFRRLRGEPNGALLFLAPTAIGLNGPGLEDRGWAADVIVTTSDRTSVIPLPSAPLPAADLAPGLGEPAPKLPLGVLLRPTEAGKGLVVAFGATTPFADGFFDARGAAHGPLLRTLLENLASPERLALRRAGVSRPEPVPEQSWASRVAWRAASLLLLPALLGIVAVTRRPRAERRARQAAPPRWRLPASVAFGLLAVAIAVPLVAKAGLQADLSREALNGLAPETRAIASRMRGDRRVQAEVVFSVPERLPPAMRPRLAQLLEALRELGRAGAEISVARVRPEELGAEGRERWKATGIEPLRMSTRDGETTVVRTVYSSLRLSSGGRSEVLRFSGPASFESLEFRLAFALRRLETGVRPVIAFAADTPRLTPAEAHEQYQTQGLMAPMGKDVYSLARELLEECGFAVAHVDARKPVLPQAYDLLV